MAKRKQRQSRLTGLLTGLINWLEYSVPSPVKMLLPAALVGLATYYYYLIPTPDAAQHTVKLTRFMGGGGSGSVVQSDGTGSVVLTNRHVCRVLTTGGYATTYDGKQYQVVSYRESHTHDLCLVYVGAYLGPAADIATGAPARYSEATVSGHPALLPNLVTHGHFAGIHQIKLVKEIRACTAEDRKDRTKNLICSFIGGLPVFEQFDSQVITATIMGGSSGSAVYDDNGDIAAVVFAGMRGLSYGFAVPHGYVASFVSAVGLDSTAAGTAADWTQVSSTLGLDGRPETTTSTLSDHEKVLGKCALTVDSNQAIVDLCREIGVSL